MFLVQHGWGNGENGGNVSRAIREGWADGVIWSPCSYSAPTLKAEIKRNSGAEQMVDPQLYVAYARGQIKELQLGAHPWISVTRQANGRRISLSPTLMRSVVAEALTYQRDRTELTTAIGPSISISAATGAPLAASSALARESVSWWRANGDKRPLLISVPVEGAVFDSDQSVHALLGAFFRIEAGGFYLLPELDPNLDPTTYTSRLERALWLTTRLASQAPVRVGYTGLNGWLFRAAGAEAFASGWFQNRRWWSPTNWLDRSGGSRLERAALDPVLALLTPADLAAVRDADINVFRRVVSGVGPLAARLRARPAQAGSVISLEAHADQMFAVSVELDRRVGAGFQSDAQRIIVDLTAAAALRTRVAVAAVTLSGAAIDGRPADWEAALRRLAARLKIQL
jgi:hypothetical protein